MQMNIEPRVTLVFNDKRLGATMVEKDLVIIDTSDAMMVSLWL
jgi:mannose-1-phosphate guanylyltransferase